MWLQFLQITEWSPLFNIPNSNLTQSAFENQKAYIWGKFHHLIEEGQYLLAAILETAEETNANVMGLTRRWGELMEISGEVESQPGKSEEE
jgi:hypothetical protein